MFFLYNSLFKFNFLQAGLIFNYIQFRYYIQILYLQAGLNVFLYNSLFKFNFLQAGLIFNYIQFRYYIQILYLQAGLNVFFSIISYLKFKSFELSLNIKIL